MNDEKRILTFTDKLKRLRSSPKMTDVDVFAAIVKMKKEDEHVRYHYTGEKKIDRISLTVTQGKTARTFIFDYKTLNVIVWPMKSTRHEPSAKNGLTVYEMQEGSLNYLYWFGGIWNLASNRNMIINDAKFMTEATFFEGFSGCLKTLGMGFDSFEKDVTYCVCWRMEGFHPFDAKSVDQPATMLNILQTYKDGKVTDLRKPIAIKATQYDVRDLMKKYPFGVITFDGVEYFQHPSPLLTSIRQLAYQVPEKLRFEKNERVIYITLRAFFLHQEAEFLKLFPMYETTYKKVQSYLDRVPYVVARSREQSMLSKPAFSSEKTPTVVSSESMEVKSILKRDVEIPKKEFDPVGEICKLIDDCDGKEIQTYDQNGISIIRDLVLFPKNFATVYEILRRELN